MDLTKPNYKNCQFCENTASFTCPKCYKPYCSSVCYKSEKHMRCTEEFYKDQVFEVLKSSTISNEKKQEMLNIIKRVENNDDIENSEEDLYEEILDEKIENLNLEDDLDLETIWSCLTKEGKQNFSNLVEKGALHSVINVWEPWWTIERKIKLVQDLGEEDTEIDKYPAVCTDIVPFMKLSKNPPPDALKYNVINILYSYAFVSRYFNGSYLELIDELYEIFLYASQVFSSNRNFSSPEEAVKVPIQLLQESDWKISSEQATSIILDVIAIIKDNSPRQSMHVLSALSDLKQIFKSTKKHFNKQDNKPVAKQCNLYIKKLEFYLSWALQYGKELNNFVNSLQIEYMASIKPAPPKEKPKVKLNPSKPLIEFLD